MKEVIYTCIFLLLLVILGVLVFFMFGPGKAQNTAPKTDSRYTPGIYRTSVQLNNNSFDLEVTVDADSIRSIHLANLSESTAAMFPLVEPVLDSLASQIYSTQSLENLDYARNIQPRCLFRPLKKLSRKQLLPENSYPQKHIEV